MLQLSCLRQLCCCDGLLPLCMQSPPRFVIVENVVGFEASRMRALLLGALDAAGMDMQVTVMMDRWCCLRR